MANDANLGFDVNPAGTSLFIFQVIFLALAWMASLVRAFVKLVLLKKVSIDDYLMLLALLGYTVTAYFVFSSIIDGGMGKPGILGPEDLEITMRNLLGNMVASGPVSGLARASIAYFLLRIAVIKWHRIVLYAIIGTTAALTVAYFFIVLFQCSPPSYFWQMVREGSSGSCHHHKLVEISTLVWGSLSAAMDWILGLLPIAMLWNVRINRQSKFGIAAILSFGIIGGIALVVRLVYVQQQDVTSNDFGPQIAIGVSAIIELSLGIIAGCIATMAPLFKRMQSKLGSGSKQSRDSIPWQRSLAGPENIIMMSPRRLERAQGAQRGEAETRRPRPKSPSVKRVLSSSNWDIEVEAAGLEYDALTPPPSRREIQIHTSIQVSSHPSDGDLSVSTIDFADKPLPPPPPRAAARDRSIPRSRRLTPNLFI
ncbi:hypothetical protein F5B22DRAFT_642143 [Xylaria bambusicola]|uniref:uncharacterized protein n=1 Tax=Xylaria bambusicola TaxID=326684 RepID=UPI00200737DC|nr:uncharacterized protein F5B22DRAFT_642143 [Xylaria bambusicola]KAI0525986.1 hypothetical protein F5B22DRAFT_642143 [Xylaria bambusicola]